MKEVRTERKELTNRRNAENVSCVALVIHTDSEASISKCWEIIGIAENRAEALNASRNWAIQNMTRSANLRRAEYLGRFPVRVEDVSADVVTSSTEYIVDNVLVWASAFEIERFPPMTAESLVLTTTSIVRGCCVDAKRDPLGEQARGLGYVFN